MRYSVRYVDAHAADLAAGRPDGEAGAAWGCGDVNGGSPAPPAQQLIT